MFYILLKVKDVILNDVMIKFGEFLSVIEYLNNRLQNNAIVVDNYTTEDLQYYSHCDDIKTYQFIVYKKNDFCSDVNLLKALQFFNSENYGFDIHNLNGKKPFKIFEYEDFKDEYVLKIKDKRALRTFQMLLHYAKSIYNNTKKQDELMQAINLPKPEYEDDKKDFIDKFSFIFNDKDFVVEEVEGNKDDYLQRVEMSTKDITINSFKKEIEINDILNECKTIIEEDIPKYLEIPKYKKGGFKSLLYINTLNKLQDKFGKDIIHKYFTKNGFDNKWKEVIKKYSPKWDYLIQQGRRATILNDED